jgi:hypothetical protein
MSTGPCLPSFLAGGRLDGVAAERGTSVSGLVARELELLVARNARYEEAQRRAVELMGDSVARGGRPGGGTTSTRSRGRWPNAR